MIRNWRCKFMRSFFLYYLPLLSGEGAVLAIGAIRWYQRWVSPVVGPHCRFYPSCSEYGVQAVEQWGLVRGLVLAGWRILRCHPFSRGGWDPVPGAKVEAEEVRSPGVVAGFRG